MEPTPASPTPPITKTDPTPRMVVAKLEMVRAHAAALALIAMAVAFVAVIVFVVFGAMKSSDVYKLAVARAKADPRVTSALGTPISEGMFMSGNTNVNGGSGRSGSRDSNLGPERQGDDLRRGHQVRREVDIFQAHRPGGRRRRRNRPQRSGRVRRVRGDARLA